MASSDPCTNWQAERSLVECNRYMLEHKIGDVIFRLQSKNEDGKESVVEIHALKTLLIARSAVFYAMFCGDMKEQSETIEVTDVEPEAFNELIRYIYTDEVKFTAANVLAVLYASKKYMVSTLSARCTEFLEKTLDWNSALTLLEQSMFFDEKELMAKCKAKIQQQASRILQSRGIEDISKVVLREVLQMETMNADELAVFQACIKWVKKECQRKRVDPTGENLRAALGDELFLIRFPCLSVQQFNAFVTPEDLLTDREGYVLYRYITSQVKTHDFMFTTEKRGNPYIPQLLIFPGPHQQVASQRNSLTTTVLRCETSADISITQFLFHDTEGTDNSQSHFEVSVVQDQRHVGSCNVSNKVEATKEIPSHHRVSTSNMGIHKGMFDVTVNNRAWDNRGYGRQLRMKTTHPSSKQLKDKFVVIDFHQNSNNVLFGIEYSLPQQDMIKKSIGMEMTSNRGFESSFDLCCDEKQFYKLQLEKS